MLLGCCSRWLNLGCFSLLYLSIYPSGLYQPAGKSADKLHKNMASVQELANRIWAGRDVEMIITA